MTKDANERHGHEVFCEFKIEGRFLVTTVAVAADVVLVEVGAVVEGA